MKHAGQELRIEDENGDGDKRWRSLLGLWWLFAESQT